MPNSWLSAQIVLVTQRFDIESNLNYRLAFVAFVENFDILPRIMVCSGKVPPWILNVRLPIFRRVFAGSCETPSKTNPER